MSEKSYEQLIAEASEQIAALAVSLRGKLGEERARIQAEISRLSDEIRDYAKASVRINIQAEHTPPREKRPEGTVDFWDLGNPKPRVYKKPDFDGHTVGTTSVSDVSYSTDSNTVKEEKIPPRDRFDLNNNGRPITGSYKRNIPQKRNFTGGFGAHMGNFSSNTAKRESKIVREYSPDGRLLHKITVRTWETENEFYGRFTSDALASHRAVSKFEPDVQIRPVPYLSYVPQYAHMNSSQVDYYRWLRENIRRGRYPDCDLGYLQLYIYEIFNLPGDVDPTEGVKLITSIWLSYRDRHPRLDGYLCEWLADYCLTNGCSLPGELEPILHVIAPKAQFKEFYLDPIITRAMKYGDTPSLAFLGKTVIEVASDYDYTSARYYGENQEAYEKHIPTSVGSAIKAMLEAKAEPFSLDRIYKMTRDSFSGAIVSSGIKKRVDIEFSSFTRRADVRDVVTALVKYGENKVRLLLGIKSKLRVDRISEIATTAIDGYFAPLLPIASNVSKEDEFMPRDYLKLYEAEDSGFDFGKAAAIERQSWVNTERLTGEEYVDKDEEYRPDEEIAIDGEITADELFTSEADEDIPNNTAEAHPVEDADYGLKDSLTAALDGRFHQYCREHGLYDGEVADRLNTLFLDIIGDVILEDSGAGYQIIEDYREDAENWLQTQ